MAIFENSFANYALTHPNPKHPGGNDTYVPRV